MAITNAQQYKQLVNPAIQDGKIILVIVVMLKMAIKSDKPATELAWIFTEEKKI